MMGKPSRDKGGRGEREVCGIFRDYGFNVERVPNSGGLHIPGDVTGDVPLHVEVKRQERISILAWVRQCLSDAGGRPSVLFWRTNNMRWRADVDGEMFVKMLAHLEAASVDLSE